MVLIASSIHGEPNPVFVRVADEIEAALGSDFRIERCDSGVDPMDPDATRELCATLVEKFGGPKQVAINFTGGTKPMSIGAYMAGLECDATLIYVDTEAEQIFIYEGVQPRIERFDLKPIKLVQHLKVQGKSLDPATFSSLQPSESSLHLGGLLQTGGPEYLKDLASLHDATGELTFLEGVCRIPYATLGKRQWLLDALFAAGYSWPDKSEICLDTRGVKFLNGEWLELYAYLVLRASNLFADVAVNYKVSGSGVGNELDVLCSLNGKLGVLECKSGKLINGVGSKALHLLQVHQQTLGGTFGKTFLVTSQSQKRLSKELKERARQQQTRLISLEELLQIPQIVFEVMTQKRG